MTLLQVAPWILVGFMLVVALILLRGPFKYLTKLILRTLGSLLALAVVGPLGGFFGISLGVNLTNALILGVLGLPGLGLLLMMPLFL